MNELPTRSPADPPIPGPHVILHEDGTRQEVYAGPNTWPRPKKQPLLARVFLRVLDWLAIPIGVLGGGLLVMAWGSLDNTARLAVAALTLLAAAGHLTIRYTRRRARRA